MKKKIILLFALVPFFAISQTKEERAKIAQYSDQEANRALKQQLLKEESERKIRLQNYLALHPGEETKIIINGQLRELLDITPNGEKIYAFTHNNGITGASTTARATSLYNGGSLGLNIQGQGMIGGIWDNGCVRTSHVEFMVNNASKVNCLDGATFGDHATHVGGTIVAQGINNSARGLAFNASLNSYSWTNDLAEITDEASTGLLVSNHSYGIGSLNSTWFYGAYDSRARNFDVITTNNPYYLPILSAGNDRNGTEAPASTQIGIKGGYDMIFGHGNAKNPITVAAVQGLNNYVNQGSVVMTAFSSYGPSDDGRIKPDISMKGQGVRSTYVTNDNAYSTQQGTSMASPGISGVVLLLQQYYNQLYNTYMRAATVKGLILHTAREAGSYPGPDYEFGWGLVDAQTAAVAIRDKNLSSNRSIIEENVLAVNGTFTKNIVATGAEPLKVSISWTDPAYGSSNSGQTDPTTKYLVNDLDLKVIAADGTIHYPWKLQGMSSPDAAASRTSTNDVDNFERVDIDLPSGVYTIIVTHKGTTLTRGAQNFALIVTGSGVTLDTKENNVLKNNELSIYPNPVEDWINIKNNNNVEATVAIVEAGGKLVKKETINDGKVSVKELEKGNYILIYTDRQNRAQSFKFIKK